MRTIKIKPKGCCDRSERFFDRKIEVSEKTLTWVFEQLVSDSLFPQHFNSIKRHLNAA